MLRSSSIVLAVALVVFPASAQLTGSGSPNQIPRFTSVTTLGNSQIVDIGTGVGIATSVPQARLHVVGTGSTALRVDQSTGTDWNYALMVNVNRDYTKAFTVNSSVTNANLFTIWGNGVVNAVKIYAQEVDVTPGAIGIHWPDDVFQSDYRLRPLQEVRAFYEQRGHLPDVPSRAEVEREGIGLGAMNAVLLRKIEELTLYVVEQQKQIDELRAAQGRP